LQRGVKIRDILTKRERDAQFVCLHKPAPPCYWRAATATCRSPAKMISLSKLCTPQMVKLLAPPILCRRLLCRWSCAPTPKDPSLTSNNYSVCLHVKSRTSTLSLANSLLEPDSTRLEQRMGSRFGSKYADREIQDS